MFSLLGQVVLIPGEYAYNTLFCCPLHRIRGKYAYLGNGWTGCSHFYEYPAEQFDADYGEPLGLAKETAKGVFTREWSKATIQMDCNTYTPKITFK